ncbi:MAG TPA: hypothetical protein VN613_04280 [Gemmatimonadaceae bacterium]|nr:hypothetical protein [Gemmatimonadaceae bacterium]
MNDGDANPAFQYPTVGEAKSEALGALNAEVLEFARRNPRQLRAGLDERVANGESSRWRGGVLNLEVRAKSSHTGKIASVDFQGITTALRHVAIRGALCDVMNKTGVLVERVQIPPGRVIAGFGPGGVVYMGVLDGDIARLERALFH